MKIQTNSLPESARADSQQRSGRRLAESVERREGAVGLLKMAVTAMNRVLVAKGVCTEDELREAFRAESAKSPAE